MATGAQSDPFSHSMTDLMAGVAVTFLLIAAIFMVQASNRAEAMEMVARDSPNLILLDLDLRGESALTFLTQLREATPNAQILVLTGLRDEHVKSGAHDEVVVHYKDSDGGRGFIRL